MTYIIIFCVSFGATMISAISGGGAGLIAIPVWFLLGMSYAQAMTIQTISSMFWVLPAAYNYLQERRIDWTFLFLFAGIGIVGALIGTFAIMSIDGAAVRMVIGGLVLLLVLRAALQRDLGLQHIGNMKPWKQLVAYPVAIVFGFYEIAFGVANGILFSVLTLWSRGFDLMEALGYYYAITFFWTAPATALLFERGFVQLSSVVPAVVGSTIGGFLGSKLGRYKGNGFVKILFISIGGILGLKLLIGW